MNIHLPISWKPLSLLAIIKFYLSCAKLLKFVGEANKQIKATSARDKVNKMGIFSRKPNIKKMKKNEDVDGLLKAPGHSDLIVRKEATGALEELFNEMTDVLSDKKIDVWPRRVAAAELFRRISSEADKTVMKILRDQVVEPLIDTLDGIEELPYGGRMMLLPPICQTLENIDDSRVIEPLRKLCEALKTDEDHQSMIKKIIEKIQRE